MTYEAAFDSDLGQTRLFRLRLGAGVRRPHHRSRGNRHIRGADQPELIGSGRLHSFLPAGTEVFLRISRTGFPATVVPCGPAPVPTLTYGSHRAGRLKLTGGLRIRTVVGDPLEVVRTCAPRPSGAQSRGQLETA